jgi:hypothetical protein
MKDLFDTLLKDRCSVWKKGSISSVNGYGIVSQSFTLVAQDVPCRVQPGGGRELESDVAYGIQQYMFFMRPLQVDDPPVDLTIHHWLQINLQTDMNGNVVMQADPDENGKMFDIKNIKNPDLLNHHFEITAELIEP